MTHLLSLPPELLGYVADSSEVKEVKTLRLVCTQLDAQFAPRVLRSLTFHMHLTDFQEPMHMVRSLVQNPSSTASRETRHILVKSLSPRHDASTGRVFHYVGNILVPDMPKVPPEVFQVEEELRNILFVSLASLRNVESVRWETAETDEHWAHTSVLDALLSYKNLTKLDISLTHAHIPIPFHHFSTLRDITLDEHVVSPDKSIGRQTLSNLARLLARSPPGQIISLGIHREWNMTRTSQAHSLADLLQFMDKTSPPLQLQHLDISYSFVRLDRFTANHLRNLTSLRIVHALEPVREPLVMGARGSFSRRGPIGDDVLEKQRAVGSTLNQFWMDLAREGIHLQKITLNAIVPGFMQYLTTYSGLQELYLSRGLWDSTPASETAAQDFFGEPFRLATHIGSLERLSIHITFEGSWSFGRHNVDQISQLKSLKVLSVSIAGTQLTETNEEDTATGNENDPADAVKLLLDMTALRLPKIQRLAIDIAVPERHRGEKLGTMAYTRRKSGKGKIVSRIRQYRAPPTCARLPAVHVWGECFYQTSLPGGNGTVVLGYQTEAQELEPEAD